MIRAWLFDLDGTLVKTERLKAISYAKAVIELSASPVAEDQVLNEFKNVVGRPRRDVAQALVSVFNLEKAALTRKAEFGVPTAWQAFVQIRLKYYAKMLEDPAVILNNQWPHAIDLLRRARERRCKTALVTMSRCEQTMRILEILSLQDKFDFIATRDDVENGKPDPEIYHLALGELGVSAEESIALEDSPSGVRAALAAGVNVFAVSTPFTKKALHEGKLLPEEQIIDDPSQLANVLERFMTNHNPNNDQGEVE